MQTRVLYALATLGLCAVAAVTGVWIAESRSADPQPASAFAGALRPPDARAPDFRLRDQDGKPVAMADYRGRTVVMTFVYSTCKDTCPAQVQSIRGALDKLGHDVPVLAVSVDPKQDTRARAKAFLLKQHVTGRVRYVLGTQARAGAGVARLRHRAAARLARPLGLRGGGRRPGPPAHRLPPLRAHARGAGVGPQAAGLAATASCAASSRSAAARYVR